MLPRDIAAPAGEPLTAISRRLGSTVTGNAYARQEGWQAMLSFLQAQLDEQHR